MKHHITITGMDCTGCQNLIKLSLEEMGLSNVEVDLEKNTGEFDLEKNREQLKPELDHVFEELQKYSYQFID